MSLYCLLSQLNSVQIHIVFLEPFSSTVVQSTLYNCFCIKVTLSQGTWALLFLSQDNILNLLDWLTLEDGTDSLSRNDGKKLPFCAA